MPLLRLRSAMALRLWLARVALLASFFLRSCVVWPRGLAATAAELGKSPAPGETIGRGSGSRGPILLGSPDACVPTLGQEGRQAWAVRAQGHGPGLGLTLSLL